MCWPSFENNFKNRIIECKIKCILKQFLIMDCYKSLYNLHGNIEQSPGDVALLTVDYHSLCERTSKPCIQLAKEHEIKLFCWLQHTTYYLKLKVLLLNPWRENIMMVYIVYWEVIRHGLGKIHNCQKYVIIPCDPSAPRQISGVLCVEKCS